MQTGAVKFFDPDRRFGFIIPDDGGKDVLLHFLAVERAGLFADQLAPGKRLKFEIEPDRYGRGVRATNVAIER